MVHSSVLVAAVLLSGSTGAWGYGPRITRRGFGVGAGSCLAVPAAARAVRPPEFVNKQEGFTSTKSGLQIKDAKIGSGNPCEPGDRAVYEWEGYTIGHVYHTPARTGTRTDTGTDTHPYPHSLTNTRAHARACAHTHTHTH